MRTILWLDDVRDPNTYTWKVYIEARIGPEPYAVVWAKNVTEFKTLFLQQTLDLWAVFFDNDLGGDGEGKDAFTWMEEEVRTRQLPPFALYAQTANVSAQGTLLGGFKVLREFWATCHPVGSAFGQLSAAAYVVGDLVYVDSIQVHGVVHAVGDPARAEPNIWVRWPPGALPGFPEQVPIEKVTAARQLRLASSAKQIRRLSTRTFGEW
jgi:hypothetical protein